MKEANIKIIMHSDKLLLKKKKKKEAERLLNQPLIFKNKDEE